MKFSVTCLCLDPLHLEVLTLDRLRSTVSSIEQHLEIRLDLVPRFSHFQLFLAKDQDTWLTLQHLTGLTQEEVERRYFLPKNRMVEDTRISTYFPCNLPEVDIIHILVRQEIDQLSRPMRLSVDTIMEKLIISLRSSTECHDNKVSMQTKKAGMLICPKSNAILWLRHPNQQLPASQNRIMVLPVWMRATQMILECLCPPYKCDEMAWGMSFGYNYKPKIAYVYVDGAPGVGKSVFLGYLLYKLIHMEPRIPFIVLDVPGITFSLINGQNQVLSGRRGHDFIQHLCDPDTIYLFDTMDENTTPLCDKKMQAKTVIIGQCVSEKDQWSKNIVLPLWNRIEIKSCRQSCYPMLISHSVEDLSKKWGGIPLRTLVMNKEDSERALEDALAFWMDANRSNQLVKKLCHPDVNVWEICTDALEVIVPTCNPHGPLSFVSMRFTSQYVCDRVLEHATLSTTKILQLHTRGHQAFNILWKQIETTVNSLRIEEEEKSSDNDRVPRTALSLWLPRPPVNYMNFDFYT